MKGVAQNRRQLHDLKGGPDRKEDTILSQGSKKIILEWKRGGGEELENTKFSVYKRGRELLRKERTWRKRVEHKQGRKYS